MPFKTGNIYYIVLYTVLLLEVYLPILHLATIPPQKIG